MGHHMDKLQSTYSHKIAVTQSKYYTHFCHPQDDLKLKMTTNTALQNKDRIQKLQKTSIFVHRLCFKEVKDLVNCKNGQACL